MSCSTSRSTSPSTSNATNEETTSSPSTSGSSSSSSGSGTTGIESVPIKEALSLMSSSSNPRISERSSRISVDESTLRSKVASASRFKKEGNTCFGSGDYSKAVGKYHRAILYLKGIDSDLHGGTPEFLKSISLNPQSKNKKVDPELEKEIISLNIATYNNLTASLVKMSDSSQTGSVDSELFGKVEGSVVKSVNCVDPSRIVETADIVLELDPANEKAKYRKAQGLIRMKDYEGARQLLDSIPNPDQSVIRLMKQVKIQNKHSKRNEAKMYKKMF